MCNESKVQIKDVLQQFIFFQEGRVPYYIDVNAYIDINDEEKMENLLDIAKDFELAYLDKKFSEGFYGGEEE